MTTKAYEDPAFYISAARRMLYREGVDSQAGGHVSLRVPGEDAFWVTPLQYFDETLPEHVMKLNFNLEVQEQGTLPAPAAATFHASILRARPDVHCVIHAHAKNSVVLSSTTTPFAAYHTYGALFLDEVGYFIDSPDLTPEREGVEIAKALGDKHVVVYAHHGTIHVAETLERATAETILFELCCGYQLAAMPVGGRPMEIDIVKAYRQGLDAWGEFPQSIWDANFRRLRRSDPDLFEDQALRGESSSGKD